MADSVYPCVKGSVFWAFWLQTGKSAMSKRTCDMECLSIVRRMKSVMSRDSQ